MKFLRIAFATLSWFLAFGLVVISVRMPETAAGTMLMAAVFVGNGALHWNARQDQ